MAVGIVVPLPAYIIDDAFIAQKAEELGFESIWYHEHSSSFGIINSLFRAGSDRGKHRGK